MNNKNQDLLDQHLIVDTKGIKTIESLGEFFRNVVLVVLGILLGYWFLTGGALYNELSFMMFLGYLCFIPRMIQTIGEIITQLLFKEIILRPQQMIIKTRMWGIKDLYYPMPYDYINIRKRTHCKWYESNTLYGAVDEEAPFVRISRLMYLFRNLSEEIASGTECRLITRDTHPNDWMLDHFVALKIIRWNYRWLFLGLLIVRCLFCIFSMYISVALPCELLLKLFNLMFLDAMFFLIVGTPLCFLGVGFIGGFGPETLQYIYDYLNVKGLTTAPNYIIIHYRWKADQKITFEQFESLQRNYDSFWDTYILKTSEGEVELPYTQSDLIRSKIESFYEKVNSEK